MSLLTSSTSALLAFQRALDTISHNVANANTEGYSRQRTELSSVPGNGTGSTAGIGNGVRVDGITRSFDNLLQARRLNSLGELGRLDSLSTLSNRLDTAATASESGLNTPWSGFFDALQGVSSQPSSIATRQTLLTSADALASRFHNMASQLSGLEDEVSGRLSAAVTDINALTTNIAQLNKAIQQQTAALGQAPNDLMDQRDAAASKVSRLIGANTVRQDDGSMNIFTSNGQALVVGTEAMTLNTVADPYQHNRLDLTVSSRGVITELDGNSLAGEVGGLMSFREQVLTPALIQLGRITTGLVTGINSQHRAGVDLTGTAGGDLFSPLAPTTLGHRDNAGTATLNTAINDVSAITGEDIILSFDGSNWGASSRTSGALVPMTGTGTAADPLIVGGIRVEVAGTAAAGDRFLLMPVADAASRIKVAITDPARIAAASPVMASAAISNMGSGRIGTLSVDDINNAALTSTASISFPSATTYSVNGGAAQPYDPATGISANGWTLILDGTPASGDSFTVSARGPGSSDNSNLRLLSNVSSKGLLDGGQTSLENEISHLTIQIGMSARQAETSLEAQTAVQNQLDTEAASVSGVNLDEEAADLMRFQQAYQAAAQMVATADSLFQTLLNAVRR